MRILIVEDEDVAARMLKSILMSLLGSEIESIQVQKSLIGSRCFTLEHEIDLLFLDLDLEGEDGFELLKTSAACSYFTIIVSGNTSRAIEAFEYGVLDFIPKPCTEERVAKALQRYREGRPGSGLKYLSIVRAGILSVIPIQDVIYFEAYDRTVIIHRKDGATFPYCKTLQDLERLLPHNYIRAHKSCIVCIDDIIEVSAIPTRRYRAVLSNGEVLPVSRNCYGLLCERINKQ